jgi:hypothetical protein
VLHPLYNLRFNEVQAPSLAFVELILKSEPLDAPVRQFRILLNKMIYVLAKYGKICPNEFKLHVTRIKMYFCRIGSEKLPNLLTARFDQIKMMDEHALHDWLIELQEFAKAQKGANVENIFIL